MTVPGHIKPLLLVLTVLGGGYSGSVKNSSIDQELDSDGLLREMYANVVGKHSTAAEPRKLVWHRICWELENTVRPKQGEKYYTLNKVPQPTCLLKEDKVVLNADDLECSAMGGRFETIEWCSYTLNCDKNVSEDEGCNDINKDGVPACDSTRSCDITKLCDDPQSWLAEDFVLRCSRQNKTSPPQTEGEKQSEDATEHVGIGGTGNSSGKPPTGKTTTQHSGHGGQYERYTLAAIAANMWYTYYMY